MKIPTLKLMIMPWSPEASLLPQTQMCLSCQKTLGCHPSIHLLLLKECHLHQIF